MIASTENKYYKKMLKKGKGSILKAIRVDKGGGKGLIAGGMVFLIFGLVLGLPLMLLSVLLGLCVLGIFAVPALLLMGIGMLLKRKREASWLSYYQENTRLSETELVQLDRELASSSVKLVMCCENNSVVETYISCFVTENYMVVNGLEPYVRRLEDIIAVAFSNSTDYWHMSCLTKQDKETGMVDLATATEKKATLCREIMQELYARNSDILCGQQIACEGYRYILERDGAEILRLYREGRMLEMV